MVRILDEAVVESLPVRSVLTCDSLGGVCSLCYGRDLARGTPVNSGEAVGVIAAQSIGEPGTQLTMRTFHIGGAAQSQAERSHVEATIDGTVQLLNPNLVTDSKQRQVALGRTTELLLHDESGREKARHRLPYGARLLVAADAKVTKGTRLAEWDPHTLPIVAEASGVAVFMDVVEGVTFREVVDEATGRASKEVVDWRQQTRSANLRPSIVLQDQEGQPVKLASGTEVRYYLPVGAILNIEAGLEIHAGDVLARLPKEASKTRDITGGLPRVAELFEARRPKDPALMAEAAGRVEYGKDYKAKRRLRIVPLEGDGEPVEYLIPKGRHVIAQEGDVVEAGDLLVDGNPVPHDILRVKGVEALASFLVNEIQEVYRLQGVKINDKHVEVIVRQMLQKVEVADAGDTTFLVGEQVDKLEFDAVNERVIKEDRAPAQALPVFQGITKASLQTQSFISAASFQETTRVLTDAAFAGKIDRLTGLKENVIVGRLIPAGSGGVMNRLKRLAGTSERFAPPREVAPEETVMTLPEMSELPPAE
jgi:DNA-directed RNA polymerase subunit beta'